VVSGSSAPGRRCRIYAAFDFYGVEIFETERYYDLRVVDGVLIMGL